MELAMLLSNISKQRRHLDQQILDNKKGHTYLPICGSPFQQTKGWRKKRIPKHKIVGGGEDGCCVVKRSFTTTLFSGSSPKKTAKWSMTMMTNKINYFKV